MLTGDPPFGYDEADLLLRIHEGLTRHKGIIGGDLTEHVDGGGGGCVTTREGMIPIAR